ncbi:endonuclease/exonuclease/phosphatase family protein [Paraburkholderia caribensis]|jgi:endonuclease/exonuclease/phosphatase family metal-dependent hydrolase|uniref:endonuclease/exonuclease/phosphatase family protein n=1 Tax=Paraburkholderia caribensis TaxID=75105 RepID=UPI0007211B46|nr:endonuclease/exonuclease/phosphatase family protein [Paraburkholderia caribensis]ALP64332.1 endonuclease [Paraburkholderia caribensis]AMV45431.1 endonuclease [Paraburkholderia caribensis]AUT54528.1 endonuclease [Paraburkholderia caribensis]
MNAIAPGLREQAAAQDVRALRIATYNIHGTVGADGRPSAERIAGVIRELDADIVALQEVPLGGSFAPNALPVLREMTGMNAIAGPTLDTPERRYGNAILSRLPICATRSLDLSFGTREARGALDVDVETDGPGSGLRVVATHLGLSARERRAQIRALIAAFDTPRMPVLLMGDLNEWFVWGHALRMLVTHFRAAPAPRTFPARLPVFALDRIWMHPADRLIDVTVHRSTLARAASDHLPLVARIAREHH